MQDKELAAATLEHFQALCDVGDQYAEVVAQLSPGPRTEAVQETLSKAKVHLLRLRLGASAAETVEPKPKESPTPEIITRGLDSIFRDLTQIAVAAQPLVDLVAKIGGRGKP